MRPAFPKLDDGPGPARRMPASDARRLVAAVVAQYEGAEPVSRARPRARRLLTAVGILAAFAGTASAGFIAFVPKWRSEHAAPAVKRGRPRPRVAAPVPAAEVSQPPPAPPRAASPRPKVAVRSSPPPLPVPPITAPQPLDGLAEANALRARGDVDGAERVYRSLAEDAASPRQVRYAARVALAGLILDRGQRFEDALALYKTELARHPRGHLDEDIRWGIVRCHRGAGDTAAERGALVAFLSAHPSSVLATSARARLAELDARQRHPTSSK